MVLSSVQKDIIFQYRDKSYICSILCQQTSDWYNFFKNNNKYTINFDKYQSVYYKFIKY